MEKKHTYSRSLTPKHHDYNCIQRYRSSRASEPSRNALAVGFTLVELIVALSIAGITAGLVMFSWAFLARHTTLQKQKAEFNAQTELAASIIAGDVRRASEVIAFDNSSIIFLGSNGDTVSYRLRNDSLIKNDMASPLTFFAATVAKFSVEKEDMPTATQPSGAQGAQDAVLVITLGMRDKSGNASEIRSRVKTRLAGDSAGVGGKSWNY